jgi:hypothetical protein
VIQVGINENVFLKKLGRSEKGALELYFSDAAEDKTVDVFAAMQSNEVVDTGLETKLLIFPPMVIKKDDITRAKKVDLMSKDIQDTKNQLVHIAQRYMTTDKITIGSVMFKDTNIKSSTDFDDMILDETTFMKVFDNMANEFITLMTPFVGDASLRSRLKLQRQNKEKHFATLPKSFLSERPMYESMEIPKDKSKIAFSKWEKDNGLDDGTPASKDAAADKPSEATPTGDPEAIFGQRHN